MNVFVWVFALLLFYEIDVLLFFMDKILLVWIAYLFLRWMSNSDSVLTLFLWWEGSSNLSIDVLRTKLFRSTIYWLCMHEYILFRKLNTNFPQDKSTRTVWIRSVFIINALFYFIFLYTLFSFFNLFFTFVISGTVRLFPFVNVSHLYLKLIVDPDCNIMHVVFSYVVLKWTHCLQNEINQQLWWYSYLRK